MAVLRADGWLDSGTKEPAGRRRDAHRERTPEGHPPRGPADAVRAMEFPDVHHR
jgi:hypothetical protein